MKKWKLQYFLTKTRTRACLLPNPYHEIRKNKNKNTTCANKNPTRFYCKEETKQGYDNKTYQKLVLNKLKVMGNSTFIYTYSAPSSNKFLKKLPTYTWPMCELWINYEWTNIQLKLNWELI
jgi:hypothetical protein